MIVLPGFVNAVRLLITQSSNKPWLWILSILVTIPSALGYSVMITICSNPVSHTEQGWVMGITSSVVAAGFGIGSAAAGTLGVFGPIAPFATASLAAFLSAILLFLWDRKYRDHRQAVLLTTP